MQVLLDVLVDSSFRVGVLLGGLRLESGWYSYVGLGEGRIAWGILPLGGSWKPRGRIGASSILPQA